MRTLIIGIFLGLFCSTVQALSASDPDSTLAWVQHEPLLLVGQMPARVQVLADFAEDTTPQSEPESGSLVIPGEENDQKDKKCLTICKKWGENCIINPRTGSRDCRRTCKEFGEECF